MEQPFSTITFIIHHPIVYYLSKTSYTYLSREELKALKERNHGKALMKLIKSRGIGSVEKYTSSSTNSGSDPSSNSVTLLNQQLKARIFHVDLFKTIEENLAATSDIKNLLKHLKGQELSNLTVNFVLEF